MYIDPAKRNRRRIREFSATNLGEQLCALHTLQCQSPNSTLSRSLSCVETGRESEIPDRALHAQEGSEGAADNYLTVRL